MANKKKKQNQINNKKQSKPQQQQPRDPREASPKEILFFKIGMSVIGLAVIIIAIIFIVQYYVDRAADDPFEDYVVISVTELVPLTKYYEDLGQYVDSDTLKQDGYEDINKLYQSNNYFYIYFYHSSMINDEIAAAVKDHTGAISSTVGGIPTMTLLEDNPDDDYRAVFFLDLDATINASIFENTSFTHLNLDSEAENMLLTFDVNANEFTLTIDINDILSTLTNLE